MRKLLLILLCLPFIGFGQSSTYIPDDNFEQHLASIGLDGTGSIDNFVITSNINTLTFLYISNKGISDLTGIQDFQALNLLWCDNNLLTTLDVSDNLYLDELYCHNNQLTSLNVSSNMSLDRLDCYINQLTSLNINNCPNLETLSCYQNQINNLDLSNNTQLTHLNCSANNLLSLNISNNSQLNTLDCSINQISLLDLSNNNLSYIGCSNNNLSSLNLHNIIISDLTAFGSINNPALICVDVDNINSANSYLTSLNGNIDSWTTFSVDCSTTSLNENYQLKKKLIKTVDVIGKIKNFKNNALLLYIYDDGSVEKRIFIE